jgi:hypothetical protein
LRGKARAKRFSAQVPESGFARMRKMAVPINDLDALDIIEKDKKD